MKHQLLKTCVQMSVAIVVMLGVTVPTVSATDSSSPALIVQTSQHCVVTAQREDAEPTTTSMRCYDSLTEALAGVSRQSSVLGIEYDKASFGGWSYVIQGAGDSGCKTGARYKVPTLPATRDNAISSARSYSGCKSRHYSGPNMSGDSYLCGCAGMGSMDNRTSSIRFSTKGD